MINMHHLTKATHFNSLKNRNNSISISHAPSEICLYPGQHEINITYLNNKGDFRSSSYKR